MRLPYFTCDVFTQTRFGGNPLAVVLEADSLSSKQMQHIAREFNYSESTFVLKAQQGQDYHVRIFTPITEYPFAGHPNVGTAFVLACQDMLGKFKDETQVIFEETAGLVPITVSRRGQKAFWCELRAPESLALGQTINASTMADILSLDTEQVITRTHLPQMASVGLPFIISEVQNRQALEQLRINLPALERLREQGFARTSLLVYTHSHDEVDIRARMLAPLAGIAEDPATGSANSALAGLLSHYHPEESGAFQWRIAQGVEMGRPSLLQARSRKQAGLVTDVWIGGDSVMVCEGFIEVD